MIVLDEAVCIADADPRCGFAARVDFGKKPDLGCTMQPITADTCCAHSITSGAIRKARPIDGIGHSLPVRGAEKECDHA
jgi:hypothetical protein